MYVSAACLCQPTSAFAGDPASTLVVDASSQPFPQSDSGDDLATLQNIFQGANIPEEPAVEPTLTLLKPVMTNLKMKRLRLLQSDNTCDLDSSGNLGSVTVTGFDPVWQALLGYNSYFLFSPSDGSGACNLIDWTLAWALNNGLSPHFAVASFLPPSFEQYGAAETWAQKTDAQLNNVQDLYKSYARKLVRFILMRSFDAGAPSVVFEVSNELDLADPSPLKWNQSNPGAALLPPLRPWGRWLWWIDPASYNLYGPEGLPGSYPFLIDMRRVEHGISPVQKIYADIINDIRLNKDAVLQDKYAGKTIDIAGPAFSGSSFQWYPVPNYPEIGPKPVLPTMEEHFLDLTFNPTLDVDPATNVGRFNAALDRFSFHFYGDFFNGYNPDPLIAPYTTLRYITNTVKTKLAALNHSEVSLFVSEWGPTIDDTSDINYSHKGAAWAAAFLTEAVADHVSMGSYLTASDFVGAPPTDSAEQPLANYEGSRGQASLTHKFVQNSVATYYPKPPANVFQMFAMMTGTRRAFTLPTGTPALGAFATSDSDSASVLVFNYDSKIFNDTVPYKTRGAAPFVEQPPATFSVELDNLPFDGWVTVKRYLVDHKTSNLQAFLDPSQTDKTDPSLQTVETFRAQVIGGTLTLVPSQPLGLGVTLWRISL